MVLFAEMKKSGGGMNLVGVVGEGQEFCLDETSEWICQVCWTD